ncbi:MAG: hypothetical protein M5R40_14510 [Anaerolineae bacterium]|nr:hypothetical protein [Anaerolineae bacterium]
MAIGAHSYGSTAAVLAFTRHLLDGQSTFNSTTRPTLSEVEAFIDRASATLNLALAGVGLATPVTQPDARLACDEWVIARVVGLVELTRQAQGWSGEAGDRASDRASGFIGLHGPARAFAQANALAFKRLGCAVADATAQGLTFTGEADPADPEAAQPRFHRDMFEA